MKKIECPKCGWSHHVERGIIQEQEDEAFIPTECPECGYEMAEKMKRGDKK